MIVYGDPQFQAQSSVLLKRLQYRLARTDSRSLSDLRVLLIQTGQFEQALADAEGQAGLGCDTVANAMELTDLAAKAFHARWCGEETLVTAARHALQRRLGMAEGADGISVTVKIPEGFEFYALYPEQYILAAQEWSRRHRSAAGNRVLVVGVRSIGTTLSALAAATLRAEGWQTRRITVRPGGAPFSRHVDLPRRLWRADWVIVVDEGPGMSGSSMAAVGAALMARGIAADRIVFFPGHSGEPGPEATPEVRRIWRMVPRVTVPASAVQWHGMPLEETLRLRTAEMLSSHEYIAAENLSGGAWRALLYDARGNWPAVTHSFERLKFRCGLESGRAVFWKFAGLGAMLSDGRTQLECTLDQAHQRARLGWGASPLGAYEGFLALPWIDGRPLRAAQAENGFSAQCACYIGDMAGPPLSGADQSDAHERLAEMLFQNAGEALGASAGRRARALYQQARFGPALPGCGDGRMALPHWLQTREGKLFKTSGVVPTDHTVIGRQTLLWDVAGALEEWGLNAARRRPFLRTLHSRGIPIEASALRFYEAAYAAFQMGQLAISSATPQTGEDPRRTRQAFHRWRAKLNAVLHG